jgi:hypothetical protein
MTSKIEVLVAKDQALQADENQPIVDITFPNEFT